MKKKIGDVLCVSKYRMPLKRKERNSYVSFPSKHTKATERGKKNFDYATGSQLAKTSLEQQFGVKLQQLSSSGGQWRFKVIGV